RTAARVSRRAGHPEHVVAGQQRDLLAFAEGAQEQLGALVGRQRAVAPGPRGSTLVGRRDRHWGRRAQAERQGGGRHPDPERPPTRALRTPLPSFPAHCGIKYVNAFKCQGAGVARRPAPPRTPQAHARNGAHLPAPATAAGDGGVRRAPRLRGDDGADGRRHGPRVEQRVLRLLHRQGRLLPRGLRRGRRRAARAARGPDRGAGLDPGDAQGSRAVPQLVAAAPGIRPGVPALASERRRADTRAAGSHLRDVPRDVRRSGAPRPGRTAGPAAAVAAHPPRARARDHRARRRGGACRTIAEPDRPAGGARAARDQTAGRRRHGVACVRRGRRVERRLVRRRGRPGQRAAAAVISCLVGLLALPALAGAAASTGCNRSWPVLAYRAQSGAGQPVSATLPIACGVATGYATSETTLAVSNSGAIFFSPANSENSLARSTDQGATWSLVAPPKLQYTSLWNTVDPAVVVDRQTRRVFWVHTTYTEDL